MSSLLKSLRDSRQRARTKRERAAQLREEYIEWVIDGVDLDGLVDLARCHLEDHVARRPKEILEIVRQNAPHLLDEEEV